MNNINIPDHALLAVPAFANSGIAEAEIVFKSITFQDLFSNVLLLARIIFILTYVRFYIFRSSLFNHFFKNISF